MTSKRCAPLNIKDFLRQAASSCHLHPKLPLQTENARTSYSKIKWSIHQAHRIHTCSTVILISQLTNQPHMTSYHSTTDTPADGTAEGIVWYIAMAPKAKAAQVPPRSAPAERPGKKPWPPKVPMGATEDAGMRLCYWLMLVSISFKGGSWLYRISRVLASCSWFLCTEVDVLIEFSGHNSELGWHLIKVGMTRYKMAHEDVRIPIRAMSTALVKCPPPPRAFFLPKVRRKRHIAAPRSWYVDFCLLFHDHELRRCHGETQISESNDPPDRPIF